MDIVALLGILLAFGGILGGQALEGGHIGSIMQPTAAVIVLGGTLGAVFLSFPASYLRRAAAATKRVFITPRIEGASLVTKLVSFAQRARREGIVSIEDEAERVGDPFFQKALSLAVDGTPSKQIRDAMEVELRTYEDEAEAGPKVYEAAGGYSPTIGILGAVLGLIHVMENLNEPGKLGAGIAVAFVATVYGVGLANLLFLPIASKLKAVLQHEVGMRELVIEGVCAMVDGENPRLIEQKLVGYLSDRERDAVSQDGGRGRESRAA